MHPMLLESQSTVVEQISTSLVTGFTDVATSMGGVVSKMVPIALPVLGGIMVITFAIRAFKSITSK